ncbi:hypothetical protein ACX3P0_23840 [Mesorhizobium sp. A556]
MRYPRVQASCCTIDLGGLIQIVEGQIAVGDKPIANDQAGEFMAAGAGESGDLGKRLEYFRLDHDSVGITEAECGTAEQSRNLVRCQDGNAL